jgi:hypothetical protein
MFLIKKNAIHLFLSLHERLAYYRLCTKEAPLPEENIQHLKEFSLGHKVPDSQAGSGSTDPIESGFNLDPYVSETQGEENKENNQLGRYYR